MRGRIIAVLAVATAVAGTGIYWYSPRYALQRLQTALTEQDVAALERYVNWERGRDGLRSDVTGALGAGDAAIGPVVVSAVVDDVASPQSLLKLLGDQAARALVIEEMGFTAVDAFSAVAGPGARARVDMVRDGLTWKVVHVALPRDFLAGLAKSARLQAAAASPGLPAGEAIKNEAEALAKLRAINVRGSRLEIREETGCEFHDKCNTLFLDNVRVASNAFVHFAALYPGQAAPEIVVFTTRDTGNCCLPAPGLLDLMASPAFTAKDLPIVYNTLAITRLDGRLVLFGTSTSDKNKLGDVLRLTLVYDRSRGLVYAKAFDGVADYAPLIGKHPFDLMKNDEARKPFVALLGDGFRDFRERLSVASEMKLVDYRYLTGSGCLPHSCTSDEGAFALDIASGKVWVAWLTDGKPHVKGDTPFKGDEAILPRRILDAWLKSKGFAFK
jgi:hypothetical protein